jgi:hypothetical protein
MSLIFNTLQRFARAENDLTGKQDVKPAKRRAYSLRRCFLSPGPLLLLGGAIVIAGVLLVQAAQSLSANARVRNSSAPPALVQEENPSQVAIQAPEDSGSQMSEPASAPSAPPTGDSQPADGAPSAGSHPDGIQTASPLAFFPPEPNLSDDPKTAQSTGVRSGGDTESAAPAGRSHRVRPVADTGGPEHLAALNITVGIHYLRHAPLNLLQRLRPRSAWKHRCKRPKVPHIRNPQKSRPLKVKALCPMRLTAARR